MGWNKSVEERFGMTEEELKGMITSSKELPGKLTELEGKMVTKEEFGKLENTLNSINAHLEKAAKPVEPVVNNNNGVNNEEVPDWGTDPDGAFKAGMRPVAGVALTAQAFAVRTDVFSDTEKYKYYPALKKEIDEYINKQPLNMRINPEVVANCYKVVLAENMDKIIQDTEKKEGRFYLESGRSNTNTETITDKTKLPAEQQLSAKELEVCKKMKISAADYLVEKNKMVVV